MGKVFWMAFFVLILGCGKSRTIASTSASDSSISTNSFAPLVWETKTTDGKKWSSYVFQVIQNQYPSLLSGSDDVTHFCPNYFQLSNLQKVNFWGELMAAVTKYESDFNPNATYIETTMGIDPVSHKPVVSAGLLQLSYQDILGYPFCGFNPNDPSKSPQDPYLNLSCGVGIMATQIKNKHDIVLSSHAYWATLMAGNKNQKIAEIQNITQNLSFCH